MLSDGRLSDPVSPQRLSPDRRSFSRRPTSLSDRRVSIDGISRPAVRSVTRHASAETRPAHQRLSHAKTLDSQFHRPTSSRYSRQAIDIRTAMTLHAPRQAAATPAKPAADAEQAMPIARQDNATVTENDTDTKPRRNKMSILLTIAAATVFVVGIGVSFLGLRTNSDVKAQAQQLQARTQNTDDAGDTPDETPPGDISGHRVAPDQPRLLTIEKIGVKARVKPLAVKADNELKAPTNIYDVGWFTGSSKPGQGGAVLLDGHVHGPSKPGIFTNLKKLTSGDLIQLERGDGVIFKYKVVKTESFAANSMDMAQALLSAETGKSGLNIITCDGKYTKTGDYERRLLVSAVAVE